MENYPDEFTMLYQRPQADMAGMRGLKAFPFSVSVFTFKRFVFVTIVLFDLLVTSSGLPLVAHFLVIAFLLAMLTIFT